MLTIPAILTAISLLIVSVLLTLSGWNLIVLVILVLRDPGSKHWLTAVRLSHIFQVKFIMNLCQRCVF